MDPQAHICSLPPEGALSSFGTARQEDAMDFSSILELPSMPMASPSYPKGPYRFVDREYLIISYLSDTDAIRAALPEPLQPDGSNTVLYEFIRMPDSAGFADIRRAER